MKPEASFTALLLYEPGEDRDALSRGIESAGFTITPVERIEEAMEKIRGGISTWRCCPSISFRWTGIRCRRSRTAFRTCTS
jgi:hypothetical protein